MADSQSKQGLRERRYLALWFPWFACERVLIATPPEDDAPFALVARVGNALRLAAVDARTAEAGLAAGMTLADARARRPDLATAPHDPAADDAALDRLVTRMRRFSPMVAPDPPHGIVLDVTGCAHLFGGEAGLVAAVCAEAGGRADPVAGAEPTARPSDRSDTGARPVPAVSSPGHPAPHSIAMLPPRNLSLAGGKADRSAVDIFRRPDARGGTCAIPALTIRHALADTAAAARALARFRRPVGEDTQGGPPRGDNAQATISHAGTRNLHALPIAALEVSADVLAGLRRAGLATLGDLARRPMAPLAARFGGETVARLRAILGEVARPLAPVAPTAPIRAEQRFAEPMARTEFALTTIEALLADCGAQMAARHLGGRMFVVVLDRADGQQRRLEVETARPLRDPTPVMRLLRERIETLADPLDPGFGFDAIRLMVRRTEPLAPQQITPDAPDDDTLAALVERLATRLGPEQVRRLVPRDSHVPERTQRAVPASQARAATWRDDAPVAAKRARPPQRRARGASVRNTSRGLTDAPAVASPCPTPPDSPPGRDGQDIIHTPRLIAAAPGPDAGARTDVTPSRDAPARHAFHPALGTLAAMASDPDGIALRPLVLLDPPAPVTAIAEVPDGPPLRFRWREALHEVRLAEGPERIAAEWWRHPQGHGEWWRHPQGHGDVCPPPQGPLPPDLAALLTRDYYRVETTAGQRLWIFRHGLYSERTSPAWYIHGLFA